VVKNGVPAVPLKNLIAVDVMLFNYFFLRAQILLPHKRRGTASALYTFIVENFWTKVCLKLLFRISVLCVCVRACAANYVHTYAVIRHWLSVKCNLDGRNGRMLEYSSILP